MLLRNFKHVGTYAGLAVLAAGTLAQVLAPLPALATDVCSLGCETGTWITCEGDDCGYSARGCWYKNNDGTGGGQNCPIPI